MYREVGPNSTSQTHSGENKLNAPIEERLLRNVETYASIDTGERKDIVEHTERTANLVKSFASNLVPEEAVYATYYHDIVDRFLNHNSDKCTEERRDPTGAVLLDLLTDSQLTLEQANYMQHILVDFIRTETASGHHRVKMAAESKDEDNQTIVSMLSDKYTEPIPPEVWRRIQPYIDFDSMRRFLRKVNVESVIIKACELYDNMTYPSSTRESAWLQDVLEAESFYAPICEVMGLDGLASGLRDIAHQIRLGQQGKSATIEKAKSYLQPIEQLGMENIIHSVFGSQNDATIHPVVTHNESFAEAPVIIGEFAANIGGNHAIAGNYRLKTAGSLAHKMNTREGLPMDLCGLTVISEGVEESADNFVQFIKNSLNNPNHRHFPAPSKEKPLYVQGFNEHIGAVQHAIKRHGLDPLLFEISSKDQKDIEKEGFQEIDVSKLTFYSAHKHTSGVDIAIPVEVQFVTKAERRRMRTGEVAHIIFKYLRQVEQDPEFTLEKKKALIESAVETLEIIYDRINHVSPNELTVNKSGEASRMIMNMNTKLDRVLHTIVG